MKIITNISSLTPPLTGIGRYTQELLSYMVQHGEVDDVKGVSALRYYERDQLVDLLGSNLSEKSSSSTRNNSRKALFTSVARQLPFARRVKKAVADYTARRRALAHSDYIYWEPNYLLLPVGNVAVSTVHDLSHLVFPEFHPQERVKLLKDNLEDSIRRSKRLVAVSAYTKQQIIDVFSVAPEDISIVPPAVSDEFRVEYSSKAIESVRKRYHLPENFLLSVGTLEPRKNVESLIHAYASLPVGLRKEFPLVLVGASGWLNEGLEQLLKPMLKDGEVLRLGYVSQRDLPVIYAAATCVGYVSFFEGYGMPIAEAMASGTAVITSNTSSMPEVASDAACLVDPHDRDSISQALLDVLENDDLRREMEIKGRLVSEDYTWEQSGKKLLNVFASVV